MRIIKLIYRFLSKLYCSLGYRESFSADGEDTILNKYLFDLEKGNYIDIGSNQPILGSNTYKLYLKNWQGICLDPLPDLKKKYNFYRPRDLFINSGIVSKKNNSQLNYYYYAEASDLSTFDINRVDKLKKDFNRIPSSIMEISTLTSKDLIKIANKLFKDSSEIHLLNIDTEGFEYEICKDFFLEKKFPWIICVEELGYTADNIFSSNLYKLMKENNYKLGSRTFLSSIYLRKEKLSQLPSPYLKELFWVMAGLYKIKEKE